MAAPITPACRDDLRRAELEKQTTLWGIDYVEVDPDQLTIHVRFIPLPAAAPPLDVTRLTATIEGGVRVKNPKVTSITAEPGGVVIVADRIGDFSTYRLVLRSDQLDPVYSECEFSFKAGCPSRFDCRAKTVCPPRPVVEPVIDYMAKDYASFRQALLDLLPTWIPGWNELHEADVTITLAELFAYVGDQLSYYQDVIGNESFLTTARRRMSVRRHARLVDYPMHDGASARTFVHFAVDGPVVVPAGTRIISAVRRTGDLSRAPAVLREDDYESRAAIAAAEITYETFDACRCFPELNEIEIYTWGRQDCCLPEGATETHLVGSWTNLEPGALLLFEEVLGSDTGIGADANRLHRQVVRVKEVDAGATDPLRGVALTRVRWDDADALGFPLCLSTVIAKGETTLAVARVSVARGNIALADHGRTVIERWPPEAGDPTALAPQTSFRGRTKRIGLREGPLSQRIRPSAPDAAVRDLMATDARAARPEVREVLLPKGGKRWTPAARDLLRATGFHEEFVVETDELGRPVLRFGDGTYGASPNDVSSWSATYRIGVGIAGNIGADTLAHVALDASAPILKVSAVRNPLPAWGGVDPEPIERVKRLAPVEFQRTQLRAVTEADYAQLAQKIPGVSRAVATFRWTGSWHTVFVTIDRVGGLPVDEAFRERVRSALEGYRIAGYDIEVAGPTFVPLEIEIDVCAERDHFRSDVEAALLEALSSRRLPDGTLGFFHPDRFTFGQPLYVSDLYAAVMAVDGVASAIVRKLQRFAKAPANELQSGYVAAGRLEVLRLDNDPSVVENGTLRVDVRGGK